MAGEQSGPVRGGQGITRRQFLIGGGAVAALAVAGGVAASRSWTVRDYWWRLTGAYGEPGALPPRGDVLYEYGRFTSTLLKEPVEYGIATPGALARMSVPMGWRAPVCFCLPGRGRSPREVLQGPLRLGDFVAQAVADDQVRPYVLVAVRAGDLYWHRRADGQDPMTMLLDEFLPYCGAEHGLGGHGAGRAVMGWSMGGYGAVHAAELRPAAFSALCAVSPALWRSFEDGVGDAFDSASDYAANDVYAGAGALRGLPVRVDCGEQDPFAEATRAFIAALPEPPAGGFGPGGHNDGYWRRVAPAEVRFIGRELAPR